MNLPSAKPISWCIYLCFESHTHRFIIANVHTRVCIIAIQNNTLINDFCCYFFFFFILKTIFMSICVRFVFQMVLVFGLCVALSFVRDRRIYDIITLFIRIFSFLFFRLRFATFICVCVYAILLCPLLVQSFTLHK